MSRVPGRRSGFFAMDVHIGYLWIESQWRCCGSRTVGGGEEFARNWWVIKGGFDAICSHLPATFSVFLWSRLRQVADIAAVRLGDTASQFHNCVFSGNVSGGAPDAGLPARVCGVDAGARRAGKARAARGMPGRVSRRYATTAEMD